MLKGASMENFIASIKERLQVPRNLAIAAVIVGLIVGLAIGYLFPFPGQMLQPKTCGLICGLITSAMPLRPIP